MNSLLGSSERLALYQLYRDWPDRQQFRGSGQEALLFHDWLFRSQASHELNAAVCTVTAIREFLIQYHHVLLLIDTTVPASANIRSEPRIEDHISVLMRVSQCADQNLLGLSARGTTLDLCRHGLRIQAEQKLPAESELDIIVTPKSLPVTFYNLVGTPRWASQSDKLVVTGVQLRQKNDFNRWQDEFGTRFESSSGEDGGPKIAACH